MHTLKTGGSGDTTAVIMGAGATYSGPRVHGGNLQWSRGQFTVVWAKVGQTTCARVLDKCSRHVYRSGLHLNAMVLAMFMFVSKKGPGRVCGCVAIRSSARRTQVTPRCPVESLPLTEEGRLSGTCLATPCGAMRRLFCSCRGAGATGS